MNEIMFISSRIENLMYMVSFNPVKFKGKVVSNISIINKKDLEKTLELFKIAIDSGLSVSPYIKIIEPDNEYFEIENGKIGIITPCSITIDGVLLKYGIPVKPEFGGVVEIHEGKALRFTDILNYESTTIDPLDILMSQELTLVKEIINTGSGKILANLRAVPMEAREKLEYILDALVHVGFSCILEVGEPNADVLGVSVGRDKIGIVIIGGTNPMALVQENGIEISTCEMSKLIDINELVHINDL